MKQIISASRRTDMPACYLDRLLQFLRQGFAEVPNPYSGKIHTVDLKPENVNTLVLWSKNFRGFLDNSAAFEDYSLYFLFTVNDLPTLESGLPPLPARLAQVQELADRYGAERVAWRFDPVIFNSDGPIMSVDTFKRIGESITRAGVSRAIFSFLNLYGKVKTRNELYSLNIVDPSGEDKRAYARELSGAAQSLGLLLESCSEAIDGVDGVTHSACIDGRLLEKLTGEPASRAKDKGQRNLCRCTVSRDIGSYKDMPCPHGCLYCYANPVIISKELTPHDNIK